MSHEHSEIAGRVDCGPEGCELDWLTSARLEVDDDPVAFQKLATDAGWGDGLPLIPPTEERVRAILAADFEAPHAVILQVNAGEADLANWTRVLRQAGNALTNGVE